MIICPAAAADNSEIDALLDAAFGPSRHTRTAAQLRVGAMPLLGPSLVARGTDGGLLGTIQYWLIALRTVYSDAAQSIPKSHKKAGDQFPIGQPFVLLGPVAVARSARSIGLGRRLLATSLTIADAAGLDPILLIGDASYYGPFGFCANATAGWSLPGPVERERLLLRQRGSAPLPYNAEVMPVAQALRCPAQLEDLAGTGLAIGAV